MKPHFKLSSHGKITQKMVGGAYEGASRTSHEIAMWRPQSNSANSEFSGDKSFLDARSRDLTLNDGYVAGAVDFHKNSIVGANYSLNAKPNLKILKTLSSSFDESWLKDMRDVVESRFDLWGNSPSCWPDAGRNMTFTSMVRLAVGVGTYTGEVLASAEWIKSQDNQFGTSIQMIDLDRLCNPDGEINSPSLVNGIKVNKFGEAVGFYIRQGHPNDFNDPKSGIWKYVKAKKSWGRRQIIHVYEPSRPGQNRAVAAMTSVLKEMKMTKNLQDVTLQNAVMNASFAATIESELPAQQTFDQLGTGTSNADYMSQVAAYCGNKGGFKIDGAKVTHLWPGQKLNLQTAASPGGVGDNFEQSLLRHIASALGMSYEQFARDYTQTNYASAMASAGETEKHMKAKKAIIADRFASNVYCLWFEEAINMGVVPLPKGITADIFYQGQFKDALTCASWIGASGSQIDRLKDAKSSVMLIENNLSTLEKECAKLGSDYRDVIAQNIRENKLIQEGLENGQVA